MNREVMQQALEALEGGHLDRAYGYIQEALAQLEPWTPEDMAYRPGGLAHPEQMARLGWQYVECPACGSEGARAFPKPEEQPVAWGCNRYIEDNNGIQIGTDDPELAWGKSAPDDNGWWPLYTSPPQRQPLTIVQIKTAVRSAGLMYTKPDEDVARAIEAAHDIGNKT